MSATKAVRKEKGNSCQWTVVQYFMSHGLEVDRHCGIPGIDSQLFDPETDVDHLGW